MPDQRQHRGPHPQDRQLFQASAEPDLKQATGDLSWLLSRGYAPVSGLKLVGDRYALNARQRIAVARCACSEQDRQRRQSYQISPTDLAGQQLWIDGYNVLTSIEAALSGAVILQAQDGCYRDLASMHGSYRKVQETLPAIRLVGECLQQWRIAGCCWLLDRPVSNSGRLKSLLMDVAACDNWNWTVELVSDPDAILIETEHVVASADSQILNKAGRWLNLARLVIDERIRPPWIVDLS